LINNVHSNEDMNEKEKMKQSGYTFDDSNSLKVTRCVGND